MEASPEYLLIGNRQSPNGNWQSAISHRAKLLIMLRDLAELVWRGAPRFLRRWGVRLTNARFTVTAAGIISDAEGRVLLLKHRFRAGSGWGIPGGFLEADEQPEVGLRRELREEIGVELQSIKLYKVRTFRKARQIEIIFRGRTRDSATPQSNEIKKASWFELDSLPEGLPDDQRRLIKDAFNHGANQED